MPSQPPDNVVLVQKGGTRAGAVSPVSTASSRSSMYSTQSSSSPGGSSASSVSPDQHNSDRKKSARIQERDNRDGNPVVVINPPVASAGKR